MTLFLIAAGVVLLVHLVLHVARLRFVMELQPWRIPLFNIYLNHQVNPQLRVHFGYVLFDVIRWGLTTTDGRTEFQILLTFLDNHNPTQEAHDAPGA